MSYTYDLDTDVGKLRLALGDTNVERAEFSDEELRVFIDHAKTWSAAALLAVDGLIARYAKMVTRAVGPRREELSDIVTHYQQLRENLQTGGLNSAIRVEGLLHSWDEDSADALTEYSR